jgi:hypothetical protein
MAYMESCEKVTKGQRILQVRLQSGTLCAQLPARVFHAYVARQ